MPKLNLADFERWKRKTRMKSKVREESLKIKRELKNNNNSKYIPTNDPESFTLLKDNRHEEEKFSRIDVFRANHYYKVGTQWLHEIIFYPSEFGIKELNEKEFDWESNNSPYIKYYEKLVIKGVGLIGDRPIPEIEKPIKRINLKRKPNRMTLTCEEKN